MRDIIINKANNGFTIDLTNWNYDNFRYIAKTWEDVLKLVRENQLIDRPGTERKPVVTKTTTEVLSD